MGGISRFFQGAMVAGVVAFGACAHAQEPSDDTNSVDIYKLETFLPPPDPGLQYVDAGSAMPADFIRETLPDFMGRQWASVVRTYWSYPMQGNGPLPPQGGGLDTLVGNLENHVQGALLAHPNGALRDGFQAGIQVIYPIGTLALSLVSAIPPLGTALGTIGNYVLTFTTTFGPYVVGFPGFAFNAITDWVPGTPPIYQVSIDYFKVGVSQPEFAHDMHTLYGPIRQGVSDAAHQTFGPIRETVGGFLHGIFGPIRSLVNTFIGNGKLRDSLKGVIANISGQECRLAYAQQVSTAWPPTTEAGFDCAGVMNLRMYVDVGAQFEGSQPGFMPVWYDPFTGQWVSYVGLSPTNLLSTVLNSDALVPQPAESLVVTIDSVKSRDDLHRLAQSIDYHGLCLAVHPDGDGCS